jgi:4-hydroxy-2-oxoheptanedioate aldolase
MSVRVSSLRGRLAQERLVGAFVKLPALESVEIVAAELDFAVVDLEHSQLSEGDALRLVRHSAALGFPALARLPAVDRGLVNRLLEAGAAGIQLSSVRSVAELRELRAATSYAPDGSRSISLSHPGARFGATPLADYLAAQRAQPPLLVAQLETAETDDALDLILGERPDVAFVGVTDITVELGLDPTRVEVRIAEIADAAERAGVALGGFGLDDPRVRYDLSSSDVTLLRAAVAGAR